MINLKTIPVLGLQFSDCNAQRVYIKHFSSCSGAKMKLWEEARKSRIVSYIPAIGIFAGVYHLYEHCVLRADKGMSNRKWHIVRSVVECFSCGFLFIVPDLIQTCIWKYEVEKERSADAKAGPRVTLIQGVQPSFGAVDTR